MPENVVANEAVRDRTILVTGGTGSFGQHFTRRALDAGARRVRIYSRDELKQYEMSIGLPDQRMRYFIGDVRDQDRLERAVAGCDIVIHAAALKQVPACEYNPFEAVKTNILGAQNVASACLNAEIKQAVALSTDKAVSPVNLYGATKLCAEKLFIHSNAYAGPGSTRFACVRYGNVVGSRGSVVPAFRKQATEGSLTITDERMTRFSITLDQAVDLVFLALTDMGGGEIFIPKVPSMRIVDLAQAMAPGLPIRFTGIRPGEKLHEMLITTDESRHTLDYGTHFVIVPEHPHWQMEIKSNGRPCDSGFSYTSDTNTQWLSANDVSSAIGLQPEVATR